MTKYEVHATWEYSEIRTITAKNEKEATQKIEDGDYDDVLSDESGQFGGFIRIESIEKMTPSRIKEIEKRYH